MWRWGLGQVGFLRRPSLGVSCLYLYIEQSVSPELDPRVASPRHDPDRIGEARATRSLKWDLWGKREEEVEKEENALWAEERERDCSRRWAERTLKFREDERARYWKRREACQQNFKAVLSESQKKCYEMLLQHDKAIVEKWHEEVNNLLVFVRV